MTIDNSPQKNDLENTVENELKKAECDFSAAFVQGLLSAYCCANKSSNDWILVLFSELDHLTIAERNCITTLQQFKLTITEQLADSELSFQLFLGSDSTLSEQALNTREWASGFWLGMQRCGLKATTDETVLEFVKDISAITAMPIPREADEASAADLIEIQEYCRMGVINLYLTQNQSDSQNSH